MRRQSTVYRCFNVGMHVGGRAQVRGICIVSILIYTYKLLRKLQLLAGDAAVSSFPGRLDLGCSESRRMER